MFDSKKYWESRYFNNGNSGLGSYDKSAQIKADYVNDVIEKYNIKWRAYDGEQWIYSYKSENLPKSQPTNKQRRFMGFTS